MSLSSAGHSVCRPQAEDDPTQGSSEISPAYLAHHLNTTTDLLGEEDRLTLHINAEVEGSEVNKSPFRSSV